MIRRDALDAIVEQWQSGRPGLDPSPMAVIGRLSRVTRDVESALGPVYARYGLDGGLFDVLATLRRTGEPFRLRSTELAQALTLTASGATKRLDRLEPAGMIKREHDPTDRRAVHLANRQRPAAGRQSGCRTSRTRA